MGKRFYLITRDLHLYLGLFVSPFVLVFAISVFFLVHGWIPGMERTAAVRTADHLRIPSDLEELKGRDQVDAVRGILDQLGVSGEVNYVRNVPKERRLVVPVGAPGIEYSVDIKVDQSTASISRRDTGTWSGLVYLHKLPGPHNANIRGNWMPMAIWRWFADGTVYVMLFLSISGIYLWAVLRAERRIGLALMAAGAISFFGIVYGLTR